VNNAMNNDDANNDIGPVLPDDLENPYRIPVEQPTLRSGRRLRGELLEMAFLIITIYALVNLSTARAIVSGPSMQPNFYTGQLVIINRFAYFFNNPARGDVVVVHNPLPECRLVTSNNANCDDLIKRAIGLPGEQVRINGGRVYINGLRIEEPYVTEFCKGCDGSWTLNAHQYLILGDNRNNSWDGHSFGPISRDLIVGEAWIRYWPPQDADVIPHPVYTPNPTQ
jgi:signal peptidase I